MVELVRIDTSVHDAVRPFYKRTEFRAEVGIMQKSIFPMADIHEGGI